MDKQSAKQLWQFWQRVNEELQRHPEWRTGQAVFNVLADMRPDLSEQIRGTDKDPFHFNKNDPQYIEGVKWIVNHW